MGFLNDFDRFHKRGVIVALISSGALLCILSLSARRFGHTFRELFPNISSRTELDRPRKKDGNDFFKRYL